jgi:large subunit ribosomal protein L9
MEVILLEKVVNLGDLGDTVKVKSGYGRNYLLPTGKALQATEKNRKVFEARKAELVRKAEDSLNAARLRAAQLEGKSLVIKALASEEGKLYGSVGPADITRAAAEAGLELRKSEIELHAGPIREVGEYTATLRLHSEVEATLKVLVQEEKA